MTTVADVLAKLKRDPSLVTLEEAEYLYKRVCEIICERDDATVEADELRDRLEQYERTNPDVAKG